MICLKDTHLMESDAFDLENNGKEILYFTGWDIMQGNNFEYKILHTDKDNEGNMLLVDPEINENKFKIIKMFAQIQTMKIFIIV